MNPPWRKKLEEKSPKRVDLTALGMNSFKLPRNKYFSCHVRYFPPLTPSVTQHGHAPGQVPLTLTPDEGHSCRRKSGTVHETETPVTGEERGPQSQAAVEISRLRAPPAPHSEPHIWSIWSTSSRRVFRLIAKSQHPKVTTYQSN